MNFREYLNEGKQSSNLDDIVDWLGYKNINDLDKDVDFSVSFGQYGKDDDGDKVAILWNKKYEDTKGSKGKIIALDEYGEVTVDDGPYGKIDN